MHMEHYWEATQLIYKPQTQKIMDLLDKGNFSQKYFDSVVALADRS